MTISDVHHIAMKDLDVLILVGGKGTRLKTVIHDRPKPMAYMGGRPFLDIIMDHVSSYGFRRFILCTGHIGGVIRDYYNIDKADFQEILFSEESKPLGTAGAIKNAEGLIRSSPFLVMNGDSFCALDLAKFLDFHLMRGALLSMAVVKAENTGDYGLVLLDESQRVIGFDEKGKKESIFINAGVYFFNKEILSLIPSDTQYSLEYDLFPKMTDKKFYGYSVKGNLIDIGTPERYKQAKNYFSTLGKGN